MSSSHLSLLLFISLFTPISVHCEPFIDPSSAYLSPKILFPNYQRMLKSFKIYVYAPSKPFSFASPTESLFYSSLQNSPFVTLYAEEAHLFFVPFAPGLSTRSIARVIKDIRLKFPYWNRTLGADHFFVSRDGLGYGSDRNLLELKKNSIQISCFPAPDGKFLPHKDITLPPFAGARELHAPAARTARYLGFVRRNAVREPTLVKELRNDSDFLIESEPSDERTLLERLVSSEFCLFERGADMSGIGEALRFGCVPVLLTDRPILDLPLMDVVRWLEIVVVVGSDGGAEELKSVLSQDGTRERRREFSVAASQHFAWNQEPKPYDAFHMVMYQLWLRRHTIRYAQAAA